MVIAGRGRLDAFGKRHADARGWIANWVAMTERAQWTGPAEVKADYPSVSVLSGNRFVFNVKGNRYRMLVRIAFEARAVVVLRLGTHAEYDRWNL